MKPYKPFEDPRERVWCGSCGETVLAEDWNKHNLKHEKEDEIFNPQNPCVDCGKLWSEHLDNAFAHDYRTKTRN